jgi:hypothetical protein
MNCFKFLLVSSLSLTGHLPSFKYTALQNFSFVTWPFALEYQTVYCLHSVIAWAFWTSIIFSVFVLKIIGIRSMHDLSGELTVILITIWCLQNLGKDWQ